MLEDRCRGAQCCRLANLLPQPTSARNRRAGSASATDGMRLSPFAPTRQTKPVQCDSVCKVRSPSCLTPPGSMTLPSRHSTSTRPTHRSTSCGQDSLPGSGQPARSVYPCQTNSVWPFVAICSIALVRQTDPSCWPLLLPNSETVADGDAHQPRCAADPLWAMQVLQNGHDAIVSVDLLGGILWFNGGAERLFGYTSAQVVGERLELLLPDRFTAGNSNFVAGFVGSGEVSRRMAVRSEIVGLRADGTEFAAAVSILKVETASGVVLTAILSDLSEQRQFATRVDQLGRALVGSSIAWFITR